MKFKWLIFFAVGALAGSWLSRVTVFPNAEAAPSDVFGSANVAVDTYRNQKGTFVVWSNGRVTNVESPAVDLGNPFRNPGPSSGIRPPTFQDGRPLGSPNVAVKAVPRGDATYVLFSDGNLKLPGNDDAAAPAATPGRVLMWNSQGGSNLHEGFTVTESEFRLTFSGGVFRVNLNDPMLSNRKATGVFTCYSVSAEVIVGIGLQGRFSSDGKQVDFAVNDYTGAGYNPAFSQPLAFQFVASSD